VQREVPKAIHVMDREADSMEIFDRLEQQSARFVIRLSHDRNLVVEDDSDPAKLFEAMQAARRC